MRDYFSEEIDNSVPERDYFTEELIQNKPGPPENILQKMASIIKPTLEAGMGFGQEPENPFLKGLSSPMKGIGSAPGIAPYMGAQRVKSELINQVNPNGGAGNFVLDIVTDPETIIGTGFAKKMIGKGAQATGKVIGKLPSKISNIWNAPKASQQIGQDIANVESEISRHEAQFGSPTMVRKGEQIINKAQKSVESEFAQKAEELGKIKRNIFAQSVPGVKQKFSKLASDTYKKYGEILDKGEAEAAKNLDDFSGSYREEVIDPILEEIGRGGAKTPAAEKLKNIFTIKEGIGDKALEIADKKLMSTFDNLDSIEKIKELRKSLFKPGADDYIQSMFSDKHSQFLGKYSPSVAEANKNYMPMRQALSWGKKNIKPFNEHEIKNLTTTLEKYHGGKLDETSSAYLKTLKEGRGEFKGSDITSLGKVHKATLDSLEKEISSNSKMLENLKGQHLEDVSTIRRAGVESEIGKQNILQDIAGKKSQRSQLKLLKEKIDRDVRTRDDLIRYGIITGLSSLGVGTGVYALSRALHEK